MEKITKEELLEQLKLNALSDEDLSNVSGGGYEVEMINKKCYKNCLDSELTSEQCMAKCYK
ncbi:MAG: hypothetical protein Q4F31_10875 [Eubacteriales bacterium]|nr:hypothetical protein [Eubacteriales bacterium]